MFSNVSKALAGAIVGLAVNWITVLWGFEVPADTVTWATGILTSAISMVLGYVGVYISPANKPSTP